jgi:sorting nexin-1/2
LAVLSGSEENSALSSAIAQLSTVQEKLEQVHYEQATADFYYLSELIKDYIGLVGAVKDVFAERVKAWQAFQALSMNLNKKREAKVKAELAQRMDKISILRQEIADLERQQEMAKDNFDRISRQIKKEVEMFDVRKANDFKRSIVKYLEYMLKAQEKMTAQWERYLPEVQQISI